MTLRFSRNFWSNRQSLADCSPRENLYSEFLRPVSEPLPAETADDASTVERGPSCSEFRGDCSLYLPEGYEPNYPYPLVVWFHRAGSDERELREVMPQITAQNCIGLSLRGPEVEASGGYTWPAWDSSLADLEESLSSTVRMLRREYHVHSERIFPAGFGEGAGVALRLFFSRPEWFGGAAILGCRIPPGKRKILARHRDLAGKRLLLATGSRDRVAPAAGMLYLAHLLHTAGIEIETRVFDTAHELVPAALRRIDHWMMEGICAANKV
jgi:phospholipase/carboxylesterase